MNDKNCVEMPTKMRNEKKINRFFKIHDHGIFVLQINVLRNVKRLRDIRFPGRDFTKEFQKWGNNVQQKWLRTVINYILIITVWKRKKEKERFCTSWGDWWFILAFHNFIVAPSTKIMEPTYHKQTWIKIHFLIGQCLRIVFKANGISTKIKAYCLTVKLNL